MIKFFARALLVTLGVAALLVIVGAGFFHFKVIKPLAQRTVVENPDDLAFVGGLVAFSCLLPDLVAHYDDIDATFTMAENLKDKGKKCKSSISAFADCAVSVAGNALDADKRKHARQQAKTAKRAYGGLHQMLSNASHIARNLPAYDDKTRAVKATLVTVTTHFAQMDMLDFLRLEEKELDAWAEATLAPYRDQLEAWTNDAEKRYEGLEPLVGVMWGAHQVSSVLSNMIMWNLNQYGFDEIMQRAPSFKFARQRGCLQGATLFDAAIHFLQVVQTAEELSIATSEPAPVDPEKGECWE